MNYAPLQDLILFLQSSPTPWHAVSQIGLRLAQQDFTPLEEGEKWDLKPGERYFVERGGSLCAFTLPKNTPVRSTILASHTDSPALKLKPHPLFVEEGIPFLRVESYGSPIISTWINRDLAIGGRLLVGTPDGEIEEKLIYLDQTPVLIPTLAIHLDREQNDKPKPVSKQDHLCPLLGIEAKGKDPDSLFHDLLKPAVTDNLLGFDLYLVPCDAPRIIGQNSSLLASYRLDNLVSAHASLLALLATDKIPEETIQMAIFWNHEEIGSQTDEGASSPFFLDVMTRISLSFKLGEENFIRLKRHSQFISIDLAHAYHPLHKKKYDSNNAPRMGKGIVIKHNANQRYATQGLTSAHLVQNCQKENIPYQDFACHSDLPCGSTVGALTATRTGIPTVDIGLAQLSMHAARELIAVEDHHTLCRLLKALLLK
ncbi:MAG: M18 family aminopeptidase [Simkania sp.]|nr:M18 family aminopeptidase [Simkania sp.]MCP5490137.1 M18 family aminopeptidase [Chlamydiales bacterium]MCP5491329.1 M18 family aminopeptidase [Chlamydiales bacterium]